MKVFQCDSTGGKPQHYTFVEVEPDGYLEVTNIPKMDSLDEGVKNSLRAFTRKVRREEKRGKFFYMRMARRYFKAIRPVPNLRLIGEF